MHEMSLLNDLLTKVEALVKDSADSKVVGVKVRLGALAHISAGHFRDHFERASIGSVAEGAKLDIIESEDEKAADAQDIVLESIEVEAEGI